MSSSLPEYADIARRSPIRKHERRKHDVTLRQHDICCFENNFSSDKVVLAGSLTISNCSHLVRHLPIICRASVIPIMGNCLKGSGQDDISLLHDEESTDSPTTGEPPPPYQVHQPLYRLSRLIIFVSISSYLFRFLLQEEAPIFIQSQHAPHLLSEEQQIRLAQRLGLIQHLPVGKYDGSKGKKREYVKVFTF